MDWTHAIITSAGEMVELTNPGTMELFVPSGCTAVSREQIDEWLLTYTDMDGICAHFGWVNQTGLNYGAVEEEIT